MAPSKPATVKLFKDRRGLVMTAFLMFCATSSPVHAETLQQEKAPALRIVEVLFEDIHGGLDARWEMKAGEEVALSFRIEGFARLEGESKEGLREERVSLNYQIALRDPQGILVTPQEQSELTTTLAAQDDQWRPKISWSARVPATAPGGEYHIRIGVSDRIAHQDISKDVSFRVLGESVPAGSQMQVVQLEYSTSEGGPWNPERYYSPSEPIWVRYKVVGYDISQDKEVWVEHDWTILDESGKVIVERANASVEKEKSFYPPRFLSTLFNLRLENSKPGKYTLRIELRDRIGEQTARFESDFFLRQ